MALVTNIISLLIFITGIILLLSWIIYFGISLFNKIRKRETKDILKKILYIITAIPLSLTGLYVISLVPQIKLTIIGVVVVMIFGLFLTIYPFYKAIRKIGDMDYFGGV